MILQKITIISLLFPFLISASSPPKNKYALVICVNKYDPKFVDVNNLQEISDEGLENDRKNILAILDSCNFESVVLWNEKATRSTIESEIKRISREIALNGSSGEVSEFLFYFSGHGLQYKDDPVFPDELDSLDESLVIYDGVLLDDIINQLITDAFSDKIKVTMLIDACNSGSVEMMAPFFFNMHCNNLYRKFNPNIGAYVMMSTVEINFIKYNEESPVTYPLLYFSASPDGAEAKGNTNGGFFTQRLYKLFKDSTYDEEWADLTCRDIIKALDKDRRVENPVYRKSKHIQDEDCRRNIFCY